MNKEFMLGCNYWASNAGTEMWLQWSEQTVDEDFEKLSKYGIKYLRVFPNWRDFQPVHPVYDSGRNIRDYRLHNYDRPENPYYIDTVMIERFGILCDLAEKHGLKLIVGLLTGGMSSRAFMPPVLYGRKIATDPTALMFQQKFVKGMVELFKDKKAIYAWDLGNECNYFIGAATREEALSWTMTVSNAIKVADPSRPLVSGMCGLTVENVWRIEDQGDNTDILTTHPYPYWVKHCSVGEVTSVQTLMHATCETKLYSELGGKPCLVEEIGTMGPMVCDDKTSADFMRLNLYSNWANGAEGVMWWCANEQIDLDFPPYDYQMCEVELGMFDRNGEAKPVLNEVKKFSEYLKTHDISLPKPECDAVCLATSGQDQWGVMFCSYVLARQAGVNIRFADATREIPDAEIYLMPSINGNYIMPAFNYRKLREKVENGAVLYISNERGILSDFNALAGVTVENSKTQPESGSFTLNGKDVAYRRERNYMIKPNGCEVIATDASGAPLFTKCSYGKGCVYYLNFPLESYAIDVCDAFDSEQYQVYSEIFAQTKGDFPITCENRYIGMTRHIDTDGEWIVLINYSAFEQELNLKIKPDCNYEVIRGSSEKIPPFEMTIIKCR